MLIIRAFCPFFRFIYTTAMGDWMKQVAFNTETKSISEIQGVTFWLFILSEDVSLPPINCVYISKDISRSAVGKQDCTIAVICLN